MKYSLGLDIGTASIGWAIVNQDKNRIEDLGVRIFERPEDPQHGESLATPRRNARSSRRRLRRRRERLKFLKEFFIAHDLISREEIAGIMTYEKGYIHPDPYLLRAKAIHEKVPNDELFIALYHIAKRRGYKSNRKAVEEADKENGRVLSAIKANQPLLAKNNNSVAIALQSEDKFKAHKRNKDSEYSNSFIRGDFEQEIIGILKTQGWSEAWIKELLYSTPEDLHSQQKSGIFFQRPFMTPVLIEKMRGKCQYEKDEPRAPKASYSFELFRAAQNLAHLRYNHGEKLTPDEIVSCIKEFKKIKSPSYATIKKVLGHAKDENFHFDYYVRGKDKNGDKNKVDGFKFYHQIKSALKNYPEEWSRIEDDIVLFDQIGEILTINKDDEQLEAALRELKISDGAIHGLMKINLSGFCHLSIKALRKLTPFLLEGDTYDKAVEQSYPGEFTEKLAGDKNELPRLSEEQLYQLTNPVVKRAVCQTRKVINAVIRKYGAPYQIKLECANDLAKSFRDRKEIEKQQKENRDHNEQFRNKLLELGITNPTGQQIIKYKLREQQDCKCQYCGQPLDVNIFSDNKIVEIDHIIPFSRCGNDSINNKVLVCAKCNQEKRDRTPFEAWGNSKQWDTIITLARNCKIPDKKRERLLCKKPVNEEWNVRALNDTRYITRFMTHYIKDNLKFSEESKGKQKVIAPTGFITTYLRKMYGIGGKDRELNNCHHAVDACIIATISQGQIKKIAEWNKYKELGAKYHAVISYDNGEARQTTVAEYENMRDMLPPWEDFAKEVRIRSGLSYDESKMEKLTDFRDKFRAFKSYDEEFLQRIHPLFVSRMAKHSIKGQAHEETLRSPKVKEGDLRLTRRRLDKKAAQDYLKNKKKNWLEDSVLLESDLALYKQLKALLEERGEAAFDEPVYKKDKKVDKNGNTISPVRTVKVYEKKPDTSGVYLNNMKQFADNGKTVCLNIYRRRSPNGSCKYFAAPLYVHSLNKKSIPILPTPKGTNKAEKQDLDTIRENNGRIMAISENGFELVAQVYPNDYIKISYHDRTIEGYYAKYGVATGNICLLQHNQPKKDVYINCSLGQAVDINVFSVSILGDNYKFE